MNERYVSELAEVLGWPQPRFFQHSLEGDAAERYGNQVVQWAESRIDGGVFLQINHHPVRPNEYSLCVYAMRYRICSGWRYLSLDTSKRQRTRVFRQLRPFYDLRHFEDAPLRSAYRSEFPDSQGWTWKRIQQEGSRHYTEEIFS